MPSHPTTCADTCGPTLQDVDALLVRVQAAFAGSCELGDLPGVRMALEVRDALLSQRTDVAAHQPKDTPCAAL